MLKVQQLPHRSPKFARVVHSVRLDIPVSQKVTRLARLANKSDSFYLSEIIERAMREQDKDYRQ